MTKKFALDAKQFKPLATKRGGCIATDMITVEGKKVHFMVRNEPVDRVDSGWRFFSGEESQAYLDDANHSTVYDVNTIANYDPDIVPFLDARVGAAFERDEETGRFVQVEGDPWEPDASSSSSAKRWPPPEFPLVEGEVVLTDTWTIHLPQPFARRIEDRALVLWRPGLTIWLDASGNAPRKSQASRLAEFKKFASEARFAEREIVTDGLTRFDYRLRAIADDGQVETLHAMIFDDTGHLHLSVYFDDPADETTARRLVDSVVVHRMP